MKKTKSEAEIIADLHISDPVAFDHIFNSFYTSLCYFAFQLTDNRQEAEDIVLETFQKFWERRNDFSTIVNVRAFLYVTVRNNCLNYLRSNTRLQKRTTELAYQQADKFERNAENYIIETEFITLLYTKINNLPKKCRKVFQLKFIKGLSVCEIAGQLNISEHTVRNHIAYSLKLLRNALGSQLLMISLFYLSAAQEPTCSDQSFHIYSESPFFDPSLFESPQDNLTMINN